jgi:hypothetical protein
MFARAVTRRQPAALVIIDLTGAHSFSRPGSLVTPGRPDQLPNGASSPHGVKVL